MNDLQLKKKLQTEFASKITALRKATSDCEGRKIQQVIKQKLPKTYYKIRDIARKEERVFSNIVCLLLEDPVLKCPQCGNLLAWRGVRTGYAKFCSSKCSNINPDKLKKTEKTWRVKYGCANPSQNQKIKNKKIATCLKNFGVKHPQQSKAVRELTSKNVQRAYGYSNVGQVPEFQKKRKDTMVERFGAVNAMGNRKIRQRAYRRAQKNKFSRKEYVLGKRTVKVQGYEPQALDYILGLGKIQAKDIRVESDGLPAFEYTAAGVKKLYFPDMLVSQNIIVEVKSTWTLLANNAQFSTVKRKRRACVSKGYKFKLLIMQSSGEKINIPNNWYELTRAELIEIVNPQLHRRVKLSQHGHRL
jgi:endogenous inhibitor of DNA gyrase (YacG/DUF329 family)